MATGWWTYFTKQRKRLRMSQADVARALGVPSSTVSRWATQAPSPETIRRLAPILKQSVPRLMVEAGHMEPGDLKLPPEPEQPERTGIDWMQLREDVLAAPELTASERAVTLAAIDLVLHRGA